jgi:hypothetical protein
MANDRYHLAMIPICAVWYQCVPRPEVSMLPWYHINDTFCFVMVIMIIMKNFNEIMTLLENKHNNRTNGIMPKKYDTAASFEISPSRYHLAVSSPSPLGERGG